MAATRDRGIRKAIDVSYNANRRRGNTIIVLMSCREEVHSPIALEIRAVEEWKMI